MGGFSNIVSGLSGLFSGNTSTDGGVISNLGQTLQGVGQVGGAVANVGKATAGLPSTSTVPSTSTGAKAIAAPSIAPTPIGQVSNPSLQTQQANVNPAVTANPPGGTVNGVPPTATATPGISTVNGSYTPTDGVTTPGTVPTTGTNGGAGVVNGGDFNSTYGVDTGTAVTNLLNSESPGSADSTAQSIIAANAPNVAQGSANLNTGLAASGISPSSSVSAIENANYQGQVAQQDASEIAQVNMTEQQQQQQLLESLLPGQQQRQTDSSGWSIFGDIMSGIGDIV